MQTELSGLKWRRLTTAEGFHYENDLDADPVLRAFSRCVALNILCTWRRRPQPDYATKDRITTIPLKLETPKELWLFWYSQEPPIVQELLNGDLVGESCLIIRYSWPLNLNLLVNASMQTFLFFTAVHNCLNHVI